MDKKNTLLLTVIAVATLLVAVVGATFAFFTAQTGKPASADVQVKTSTSDSLSMGSFGAINIYATQENFYEGAGNAAGSTSGTISLTANEDKEATYCYTAKLNIETNSFGYTTEESTPELTFTVTKDNVAVIEDKDITTATGTIDIPTVKDGSTMVHSITAAAGKTVDNAWKADVTLVNLASDQNANTGKLFTATLVFDKTACE